MQDNKYWHYITYLYNLLCHKCDKKKKTEKGGVTWK